MAQHQELKRKQKTVQQTAKHDAPPPLSIELSKKSDLPNKAKPWSDDHLPVDILLVTVEDCEFLACYAYMRNAFESYHRDLGFIYFGNMGESEEEALKVALIRCSEGSSGPGGAQITVKNAVMQLRPKATFSVGCCEGLNPEDTKLGDVVISSELTTEDFKTPVGKNIANLIRHAADGWKPPLTNAEAQNIQVHRDSNILSGMNADSAKRRRMSHSAVIATEHEGQAGIEPKGSRIALRITDPLDLNRDILKSETCEVKIPSLDFVIQAGTLGGRFTTLEGLLSNIKDQLQSVNPFGLGDSPALFNENMQKFVSGLDKIINGEELGVVIMLDDPAGNSYIQNLYAPDPDPELEVVHYERSKEQDDELGISDMKTEGYEQASDS